MFRRPDAYATNTLADDDGLALSEPIRVLHVINGEHYAGAERVQDLLAANLPRFGFSAVFAALKPDQFAARRRAVEAPLYSVPMRTRFDLRPARALVEIAKRERCRMIHTHTVRAALVGRVAASMTRLPMVHHLHSPTTAETTRSLRNLFNSVVERMSTCNIAAAIAVSHSLARYGAEHGIPAERITVVHNGVPVDGAFGDRSTPRGTWTLGCMALYRPRKGLETLLDALRKLRDAGVPVRLRAVGKFETGAYEREIHERVERLGLADLIDWRGFRSDIRAEFSAVDLFVLPSLFGEGLPMVMLEAMAFGVPVVASRVEGVPDAIVDGRSGLIVEPGDPAALAAAITRCVRGEVAWQTLRHNARQRQVEHFSDHSMAAGTAEVYRRVLGEVPVDSALHSVVDETAYELVEA
jgi:glycosyltransferase involved in cell wall biosynthesis